MEIKCIEGVKSLVLGYEDFSEPLDIKSLHDVKSISFDIDFDHQLIYDDIMHQNIMACLDDICKLKNLTILILNATRIRELPFSITELKNLENLDLSFTEITALPEFIGELKNLKYLNLSCTEITTLPESIVELKSLECLNVSETNISILPESIGELKSLKYLDLSITEITTLPESIRELKNLVVFDLSDTHISILPESIVELKSLEYLDLSGTEITTLLESIGLMHLKHINLSKCKLTILPKNILRLNLPFRFELLSGVKISVGGIILWSTELSEMDINIFKLPREYIEQYYNEMEKGTVLFNEVRVIFLGDGYAGKTTIIEMLKGKNYIEERDKTDGIDIHDLHVKLNNKEELVFHLWDFGGQEIYHSTHEMFLRDNCIYVIVLDGRKEDRPEYWLDFVKRYGKSSPVLLVVNKCDDKSHRTTFSLYELSEKFADSIICDFEPIYMSCKYKYGFSEFEEKLYHMVDKVNGYNKQWPVTWLRAKQKFDDMRDRNGNIVNYIDQRTYYQYCEESGVYGLENKKALLAHLCDIGTVFSYQSKDCNNVVDEFKVLRPEWITKGIYTILNSDISRKCNGYVPLSEMEHIFTTMVDDERIITYYPSEREFVLSIMEEFKMSYQIGEYEFIPSMASAEKPEVLKDWEYSLSIYFETDGIFPDSLLYQFIVEMAQDVNIQYTWIKGTLLSSDYYNVQALVQKKDGRLYINIDKKNEDACNYLSMICGVFSQTFRGLNIIFREYVGLCYNGLWKYLDLERMVNMLANGKRTDYIDGDGWDCDVNIREALSYITPYAVMKQIDKELALANTESKDHNDFKEELMCILRKNQDNYQKIFAYLDVINKETKDINQLLTDLQKELPYDISNIHRKIDEAIIEIKEGNHKSAHEKIQTIISELSDLIAIKEAAPHIIELIKFLFELIKNIKF